jgi:hypothetical protein
MQQPQTATRQPSRIEIDLREIGSQFDTSRWPSVEAELQIPTSSPVLEQQPTDEPGVHTGESASSDVESSIQGSQDTDTPGTSTESQSQGQGDEKSAEMERLQN